MWRSASQTTQVVEKRGPSFLKMGEEGIEQKNVLGAAPTSWRASKAIRDDKHNLYFLLEVAGSKAIIMAILIPRRVFASPQEAESFLERARGYWREHTGRIV